MYGYIYQFTNRYNGKIYIGQKKGQTICQSYYGGGVLFKLAKKKYGIENFKFEVLEWTISQEDSDIKEKYWIQKLDSTNKDIGYNIAKGGKTQVGENNGMYGKNHSLNTCLAISKNTTKYAKLRKESMTHKEYKLYCKRYGLVGEKNPMFGRNMSGEKNPMFGKENKWGKHTEEAKLKISKKVSGRNNGMHGVHRFGKNAPAYGHKHTNEAKKKISDSQKGVKHWRAQKILLILPTPYNKSILFSTKKDYKTYTKKELNIDYRNIKDIPTYFKKERYFHINGCYYIKN